MKFIKKILISLSLITLGFIGIKASAPGPYHEDVGNGRLTQIDNIKTKSVLYRDGTKQVTAYTAGAMSSVITLSGVTDTVEFPEMPRDYQFDLTYLVTFDTLGSDDVTISLEEKQFSDSSYVAVTSSIFPYTLDNDYEGVDYGYLFLVNQALRYQRIIINWGTSTVGTITVDRRY
jgi:hypothetical protein